MEVLEVDGKLDGSIETLLPKVVFLNDGVDFFLMYLLTIYRHWSGKHTHIKVELPRASSQLR